MLPISFISVTDYSDMLIADATKLDSLKKLNC